MDVTSEEIRSSRFQGTRHVYDRREVDAFLHRAAATLEVYERKLTVMESHLESQEIALELAQSRARLLNSREARIAELESALAAAQHNYESALQQLENGSGATQSVEGEGDRVISDATREASRLRDEAEARSAEMAHVGEQLIAAAQAEAEKILRHALDTQSALLAEAEADTEDQPAAADENGDTARRADVARLEMGAREASQQAEAARSGARRAEAELAEAQQRLRDAEEAAAEVAKEARKTAAAAEERSRAVLEDAEARAAEAQRRASQAEEAAARAHADSERLAAEIEAERALAETQRIQLMADAEQMVAEAVAQAEVDRDKMLAEARSVLARAEDVEAKSEADRNEVATLRRQVAQMRTALSNIQHRFTSATELSPEEVQLAAALVDLDLHDVDQLVDLTAAPAPATRTQPGAQPEPPRPAQPRVVKSKWVQSGAVPAGSLREGRADRVDASSSWSDQAGREPNWREALAAKQRAVEKKRTAPEPDTESLGFYERRLAGLRERIKDATVDE